MTKAVLLDALGTVIELRIEAEEPLREAFAVEMIYYREHAHEARDADTLFELRRRCAELLARELGRPVSVEEMMAAVRFRAYPDASPALDELANLGQRRICVSNWDYALGEVLGRCGLADRFDAVVTSAAVGSRKPDPRIFRVALDAAGCSAEEALVVGDTLEEDIAGAGAAGIPALLIDRNGGGDIASLAELGPRLR
jgi:putative hydrolase of the HAD superfamily